MKPPRKPTADPERNYNTEDGMIIVVGDKVIRDGEAAHLGLPPLTKPPKHPRRKRRPPPATLR